MSLTLESATRAVNRLALMAFFPAEPEVRAALVEILMELAETQEQLDWLVARALKLYPKWPGVSELRALYCSRFKPRDGVESYSEVYPEGIPSERPPDSPPPPKREKITTSDPEFEREIQTAAKVKEMPRGGKKEPK